MARRSRLNDDEPRAALNEAVARCLAVEARLTKVHGVITQHRREKIWKGGSRVEDAEEALAKAREAEPANTAARMLGETSDFETPTIADAEAELADAKSALVRAEREAKALEEEERASQRDLAGAQFARDKAVTDFLRNAPEVVRLLAERDEAKRWVEITEVALHAISRRYPLVLPHNWDVPKAKMPDPVLYLLADRWDATISALLNDPKTSLPSPDEARVASGAITEPGRFARAAH